MTIKLEKEAKQKKQSRDIVKTIIDFGVTEQQKTDIMFFLAMTLNNHSNLQEITNFLKKFKSSINKDEKNENNSNKSKLIIK
jgi:hypothetical protein